MFFTPADGIKSKHVCTCSEQVQNNFASLAFDADALQTGMWICLAVQVNNARL